VKLGTQEKGEQNEHSRFHHYYKDTSTQIVLEFKEKAVRNLNNCEEMQASFHQGSSS
jgi:hypothetical protein